MVRRVMHDLSPKEVSGAIIGIPIVNVSSRYGGINYKDKRMVGLNNIELITDRPLKDNLYDIEEVKNPRPKSNWMVYEIEVEAGQSLEDLLNEKCRGFYLDRNLIQRENQIRRKIQESNERYIEDLKKNGIRKTKISEVITTPIDENKQNRGIRI